MSQDVLEPDLRSVLTTARSAGAAEGAKLMGESVLRLVASELQFARHTGMSLAALEQVLLQKAQAAVQTQVSALLVQAKANTEKLLSTSQEQPKA